jgi:uncharacterized protein (DUF1330 family)
MTIAAFGFLLLTAAPSVAAPTYLVAEFEVIDAAGFKEWGQAVSPIGKAHGAQVLSRGQTPVAAVGEPPKQATIILFESMEKAEAYRLRNTKLLLPSAIRPRSSGASL